MVLAQLNISAGGMPKLPVLSGVLTADGLEEDWQLNRKYHGGPDRAVCVYSVELYAALREEGVQVYPGQLGENFTTKGIDLCGLAVGDRLLVGGCVIELTSVRAPCRQLNRWHADLMRLIKGRSGWLARVVVGGPVVSGDTISLVRREGAGGG